MYKIKRLIISLLILSNSAQAQVCADVESEVSAFVGDIILSYQKSDVKKFKVKYSEKFGRQCPLRKTFHYKFENDSLLTHYTSFSFQIFPILSGILITNSNWFYWRTEKYRYIIRNNEFQYLPTKEALISTYPPDFKHEIFEDEYPAEYDSIVFAKKIEEVTTQKKDLYTTTRDTQNNVVTVTKEYLDDKQETRYFNDTIESIHYKLVKNNWVTRSHIITSTKIKGNDSIIISKELIPNNSCNATRTFTTIITRNNNNQIKKISIDFSEEVSKQFRHVPCQEKKRLEVKILKRKKK
jgi:hypothetical protein